MVDASFAPMDMRSVVTIPDGPGWQYEPKWDGFRCLAHRDGTSVALTSKSGQPLARYFPEIAARLAAFANDGFSLDGELVVPVAGAFSFDALQQRIHPAASRVAMLARTTPAIYLAFDLLRSGGVDRIGDPLESRRADLERFAARETPSDEWRLSPATTSHETALRWFDAVGGALDGIVAKRLGVPYASGSRDAAVKVKRTRTADCVIGGFRYAQGSTTRAGSLLLGLYDERGLLDYIGFCSAFPNAEREALATRMLGDAGEPGFTGLAPDGAPSRWNRGEDRDRSYVKLAGNLVLEVGFDQVTGGRIRHGTKPLRWRTDKSPRACTVDQLDIGGATLALLS
jgi:ATP-dependent DNA ligase